MRSIVALGVFFGLTPTVFAQQSLWGQCGGIGYTGPTICVSGACCIYNNDWHSQCLPGACTTSSVAPSSTTTSKPTSSTTTTKPKSSTTSTAALATFTNPVVYSDFADNDVFRGPDNVYYFSASNMHYSPGAPILKSLDLVNWEHIGHSVPSMEWGSDYDMGGNKTAYVRGTWASTMRYRESNKTWYWIGCVDFWVTYIYTASSPTGPWVRSGTIYKCYYDCGLHIDDDDTMYVVYGNKDIYLSQLTADGLSESRSELILSAPPEVTTAIEGDRMYKRNGVYYVLNDWPEGSATYIWKASNPWGPYTSKVMGKNVGGLVGGGSPIQGSLVETQKGDWYFMSFVWAYPSGRMPVLAPVTWGSDGFPILGTVGTNQWGTSYPNPLPTVQTPSWTGTDTFAGTKLGPAWEWNHNPDTTKFTVNNGITLSAATVTDDLFHARNTLTHRVYGPQPVATIELDFNNMADGDRCGFAAFRHETAYIGVYRSGSTYTINMVSGLMLNSADWQQTLSLGTVVASRSIAKGKVWLRGNMDARADGTKLVTFQYSTDGTTFTAIGNAYTMNGNWPFFMGYRWAIFNYATKALGGSVKVASFKQV